MLPIPQTLRFLARTGALLTTLFAAKAWACGGCFSPPMPQQIQTIVQDAERVLFMHDPASKKSTVWVEVRYSGAAKEFGWVLPVPKLPKVGVGSTSVFDALDSTMAMRYQQEGKPAENCRSVFDGCVEQWYGYPSAGGAMDASSAADYAAVDASGDVANGPTVQILSQGSTGPYDYVVVQSTDAKVLYDWLTQHGYDLPAKAKPIIQSHIDQKNVFVAVHLQNGQGVEAIRPIALEMIDSDPCVPLRLTSIASAEELKVVVTVAGPGRAVPKNHLAVEPNPLRMTLGQFSYSAGVARPANFDQVLAGAIDEAGGRAFVTESALSGPDLAQYIKPNINLNFGGLGAVTNADQFVKALLFLPLTAEVADTLAPLLKLDAVLPGVPTLQALADLRSCAQYWQMPFGPSSCNLPGVATPITHEALQAIAVDGAAMVKAIEDNLIKPVQEVAKLLGQSATVTRLSMRISPDEMDRDPIFAFNSGLPMVSPARKFATNPVCSDGWWAQNNGYYYYPGGGGQADSVRYTFDGLGTWIFGAQTQPPQDPRFAKAPLALTVQVLEESGKPIDVAKEDVPVVVAAIAGAKPGKLSLDGTLVLKPSKSWLPPPSDVLADKVAPWKIPSLQYGYYKCTPKACWVDGQLPPDVSGVACGKDEDAGGDGGISDAGSTDAGPDVKSGPVPGVDSANGWTDGGAGAGLDAGVTGETPAEAGNGGLPAKSGCGATPAHASASPWLALLAAVCLGLWRRRRA